MSTGLYSHTTRATGTILTAAIYNADHQNHITNHNPLMMGGYSDTIEQMQLTTDPGDIGSENPATNFAGELERMRYVIKRFLGADQWYENKGAFSIPIGCVMPYFGPDDEDPPTMWLWCNGQAVSRTTYSKLYAKFGTRFGAGNGTSTFNVPKINGRFIVGKGNMAGTSSETISNPQVNVIGGLFGNETQTIQRTHLPNYNLPHNIHIQGNPDHLTRNLSFGTVRRSGLDSTCLSTANFNETTLTIGGSVQLGGDGTPLDIIPPSISASFIVYAGQ